MNDIDKCECENTELRFRAIKQVGRQAYKQFVWQCLNCGKTSSPISHTKLTDAEKNRAKEIDKSISKRYWEERREANKTSYAQKSKDWFKMYSQYLRSGTWAAKRTAVLRRDGYKCQACLSRPAAQVHHLTYDHLGNEPLFDLISVCEECHEKITEMDRAKRNGVKPMPPKSDLYQVEIQP